MAEDDNGGPSASGSDKAVPKEWVDLEVDSTSPYGPMSQARYTITANATQSWECGMQPHFNFLNIRNVTKVQIGEKIEMPPRLTDDWRVVDVGDRHKFLQDHKDRAKHLATRRQLLPVVHMIMLPKHDMNTWAILASYGRYVSTTAAASWAATDGKFIVAGQRQPNHGQISRSTTART